MRTRTVIERIGENMGPVDWAYPTAKDMPDIWRDAEKAARLGTLSAQMDKASFRQETLRQKLADRRRSEVV